MQYIVGHYVSWAHCGHFINVSIFGNVFKNGNANVFIFRNISKNGNVSSGKMRDKKSFFPSEMPIDVLV